MNTYTFEDIVIGMKESFEVTITNEMMDSFKAISGDINPLHNDEKFAKEKGYIGRVVYGMLTASFLSTLAGVYLPGERSLIQRVETKFLKPVFIRDTLKVEGEVIEKHDNFQIIILKSIITNQHGEKVLKCTMQIGIK